MIHGCFMPASAVNNTLEVHHYLGPINRGFAWENEDGVIVLANPTSRRLPTRWLELVRWCIVSRRKNAGSSMWSKCVRSIRKEMPDRTTVVSYSDPSVGHTGSLYRACNWVYAPTWHRLRPPPSGHGQWTFGKKQSVKDRWVFILKADHCREHLLQIKDESILRKRPELLYRDPYGVSFKETWK